MTILLLIKNFFKSEVNQNQQLNHHHNRHVDRLANSIYHI